MDYVELAIKSGGFMAMDRFLLTNRLATLETEQEKLAYICPPASVVNAYFAELYQKQGPEAATAYFLDLSTTFSSFSAAPSFVLEGSSDAPTFRFIRLNLSGKSFGFAYENATERMSFYLKSLSFSPSMSLVWTTVVSPWLPMTLVHLANLLL